MKLFVEIKLNNDRLNEKGLAMGKLKHGQTKTRLYQKWLDMRHRCLSPKSKRYSDYGGRGISICNEWSDYKEFRDWSLQNGYYDGCKLSIDRIDNNGDYSPNNCRYTTQTEQMRNTRVLAPSNTSGYRGVTKNRTGKKWVAKIKVDRKTNYIGSYQTAKEAGIAYNNYVVSNSLSHTLNPIIGDN